MNIALIQPFTGVDVEPPKSLACIAAVLDRAGHKVRLIDLQICKVRQEWEAIFNSEPVDMVGITAMTPQVKEARAVAERVKTMLPDVPIVLGGVHATLLPRQTLQEFNCFDILVIGEGEETAIELASRLEKREPLADVSGIAYRSNGDVAITPRRPRMLDLDSLPNHHDYYDFDFYLKHNTYEFSRKSACLIISRGCPFSCSFCATNNFWTRKYICKSVDGVIDEIRYVLKRGAEDIKFRDSTFIINKKWVHEFCEKIIKQKLRFKWAVNARIDLVDYDLFRHMKKAGLDSVFFGVESGSQRILDFYKKGITIEQTEKAFEICHKLRICTGAYFMLGALPETREDMELTYQFAKKLRATFSFVFVFMPLPGSELYQHYIDQGYKFDYNNIRSDKANFSSAGFTLEELESMRDRWYHDFNKRPPFIIRGLNALRDIRSFYDLKRTVKKVAKHLPLLKNTS